MGYFSSGQEAHLEMEGTGDERNTKSVNAEARLLQEEEETIELSV
jgi:hypothetical protein